MRIGLHHSNSDLKGNGSILSFQLRLRKIHLHRTVRRSPPDCPVFAAFNPAVTPRGIHCVHLPLHSFTLFSTLLSTVWAIWWRLWAISTLLRGLVDVLVGSGRCIIGLSVATGLSIKFALGIALKGTLCIFDPISLYDAMLLDSFGRCASAMSLKHILEDQYFSMVDLGDPLFRSFLGTTGLSGRCHRTVR